MIAKASTISHGANAIRYSVNKEKADIVKSNLLPDNISPEAMYGRMMLIQKMFAEKINKGRPLGRNVIRIEISPSEEESQNWTMDDWVHLADEFIRVFEEEARKLDGIDFLAQGTIYPDIVESGTKTAKMVKSHHNVGGLPEDLQFELVEPLRQLFKDEVRACGVELGLPYDMVYRQPFPGPGLGVRCLGAITRDRLEAVRESDAILREEFKNAGLDKKVWQYFTVVPDFKSVGVRDNARSFEWPVIIRAVNTVDAMTATIEPVDWPILMKITDRILKEVKNVNRVCYDMSPKPNATIEWE